MTKKILSGLALATIFTISFIACNHNVTPEPEPATLKDLLIAAKDGDTVDLETVKFTVGENESFTINQKNLTLKNGNVKGAAFVVEGANVIFQNLTDITKITVDEKIGDADFTLANCSKIEEIYLNGGGSKSVHISGTEIGKLVANKKNLHIQLDDDGATKIEKTFIFKDCSFDSKNSDNKFGSIVISDAVSSLKLDGTTSIDKIISTAESSANVKITVNKDITIASADKTVKESIASNEENKEFNEKQETIQDATLTEDEKKEIEKVKEDAGIKEEHTHTFSDEWTSDDTHHWHAATCDHSDEVSGKAEHTWDEGVITTKPTVDAEGVTTFTCSVCNKTRTETIEKLSVVKCEITFVSGDIELANKDYTFTAKLGDTKTFTWYFNGEKLSETSGTCDMTEKVKTLDAGYYELIVTAEKDGVTYSATCKVKVN